MSSSVRRQTILSDDESSDDGLQTPQPRKTSTRTSKPSEKQAANNQKAKEAEAKRYAEMEKKLKKLERVNAKLNDRIQEHDASHVPPEPEETDDIPMSRHQRAIVSKGVFAASPPRTAKVKRVHRRKDIDKPVVRVMPERAPLRPQNTNIDDTDGEGVMDLDQDELNTADKHQQSDDDDDLLRSDTENRRSGEKRTRTSSRPSSPTRSSSPVPSRPKKKTKTTAVALDKVRFVAGHPPAVSRTNLADLVPAHRRHVQSAQNLFEIFIATRAGYPDAELAGAWAIQCWDEDDNGLELSTRVSTMITKYGVHARSAIVGAVRPLVARHYKLEGSVEEIKTRVGELLTNNAFAYADPDARDAYAENTLIKDVIQEIWFSKSTSRGVKFAKYFSPITLPTFAIVLTAIEFSIKLWETGERPVGRVTFDETYHKTRYEAHLQSLEDWDSLVPEETLAYRQELHDRLRKACTGSAVVPSEGGLAAADRERALAQLQARRAARGS